MKIAAYLLYNLYVKIFFLFKYSMQYIQGLLANAFVEGSLKDH